MAHGANCETCGGACAWEDDRDDECEWCDGTGVRTFCPLRDGKCEGCEEMQCEWCDGEGKERNRE